MARPHKDGKKPSVKVEDLSAKKDPKGGDAATKPATTQPTESVSLNFTKIKVEYTP